MDRDALKQYLDTYFDTSEETQPVSLSDLTKFFEAAGKYHKLSGFQPSAVAKTMVEHGLTTTHVVGRLQRRDLQDMGMLMGHAMVLVQHLGERSMDTPGNDQPAPVSMAGAPAESVNVTVTQDTAALGSAVASAVAAHKDVPVLMHKSAQRPTVKIGRGWIKEHRKKQRKLKSGLANVLKGIMEDPRNYDVTTAVSGPLKGVDEAFYEEVEETLTDAQLKQYGGASTTSGCALVQQVYRNIVDKPFKIYQRDYMAFQTMGVTKQATALPGRLDKFKDALTEIRYSKYYEHELDEAIEALVDLLQPMPAIMTKVSAKWEQTDKSQHALDELLAWAAEQVELKAPYAVDTTPNKPKGQPQDQPPSATSRSTGSRVSFDEAKRAGVCVDFLNGRCSRSNCKYKHEEIGKNTPNPRGVTRQVGVRRQINKLEDLRADAEDISDGDGGPPCVINHVRVCVKKRTSPKRPKAPTHLQHLNKRAEALREASDYLVKAPIIDTYANIDAISGRDKRHAVNIRPQQGQYSTVAGDGGTTEVGTLRTPVVDLVDAPIIPQAKRSIVSGKTLKANDITYVQTPEGAAVIKEGKVMECPPEHDYYRLPMSTDNSASGALEAEVTAAEATVRAARRKRRQADRKRHRKRCHTPEDPDCIDCQQAKITKSPSKRLATDAIRRGQDYGRVLGVDYKTDLPADKDGNTIHFQLVDVQSGLGVAVPTKSRSGKQAVHDYKEAEYELLQLLPPEQRHVSRVHSDRERSFVHGDLRAHLMERNIDVTDTGGYDSNANAKVERRLRSVFETVRALLLTATGGRCKYVDLWGLAAQHANYSVNNMPHGGPDSPMEKAGGICAHLDDDDHHVFGAHVTYYEPAEKRDGPLDTPGRVGIWVGKSTRTPGGHLVCELHWNAHKKQWVLGDTVVSKAVKVDDDVFPLMRLPATDGHVADFDQFVDRLAPEAVAVDVYEVKAILDRRERRLRINGKDTVVEYLVQWSGYSKREATWEPAAFLTKYGAADLVHEYEEAKKPAINHLGYDEDLMAVIELMQRHNLPGSVQVWLDAYKLERDTVERLRLRELHGQERERVLKEEKVIRTRFNPEPKHDGRCKFRWLVRGDMEPAEWHGDRPKDSPTPMASSVKLMIAEAGTDIGQDDEISVGDITTAFLKGKLYGPDHPKRYIAHKPCRGARLRVYEKLGSQYGDTDAPRWWYDTLLEYLQDEGYQQAYNDPCLFRHPETRMRIVVHVDDILARGPREHSSKLWDGLHTRFGLKEWGYVQPGSPKMFLGMRVSRCNTRQGPVYTIDQNVQTRELLAEHCPTGMRPRRSPMPRKAAVYADETELTGGGATRYRSLLMSLSWLANTTRFDLSYAVSRLAQWMKAPTVGAEAALKRVLAYLLHRPEFTLVAERGVSENRWEFYVDSDVAGDQPVSTKSHTGVLLLCNGMPVQWRSNKQPLTSYASATAEIYAFSEAVKDAQLLLWRAEDLGVRVKWPCEIYEDNAATVSFQKATVLDSKVKGVYNLRWDWVRELRDASKIKAVKVDTDKNVADLLTKCQEGYHMQKLLKIIGYDVEPSYT